MEEAQNRSSRVWFESVICYNVRRPCRQGSDCVGKVMLFRLFPAALPNLLQFESLYVWTTEKTLIVITETHITQNHYPIIYGTVEFNANLVAKRLSRLLLQRV